MQLTSPTCTAASTGSAATAGAVCGKPQEWSSYGLGNATGSSPSRIKYTGRLVRKMHTGFLSNVTMIQISPIGLHKVIMPPTLLNKHFANISNNLAVKFSHTHDLHFQVPLQANSKQEHAWPGTEVTALSDMISYHCHAFFLYLLQVFCMKILHMCNSEKLPK